MWLTMEKELSEAVNYFGNDIENGVSPLKE
jgi:hypothetical protein